MDGDALSIDDTFREIARSAYADMIHDADRNEKYEIALQKAIAYLHSKEKKAIVLDIGTGSGLLSMMALRHGADVVYACDAFEPAIKAAERVLDANNFKHGVKLIFKRSTDLTVGPGCDLETKANILVTEVFDTELIGEGAIETFRHAMRQLLSDDCIIIPHSATIYAMVVKSTFLRDHHSPRDTELIKYHRSMIECLGSPSLHDLQASQLVAGQDFMALTEPVAIFDFVFTDMNTLLKAGVSYKEVTCIADGTTDAVIMWWTLTMTAPQLTTENEEPIVLTCAPTWQDPKSAWRDHWMQAVYYPQTVVDVITDQNVFLCCCHDEYSMWFNTSKTFTEAKLDPPVCECAMHVTISRSRIAMNNDTKRQHFFLNILRQVATDKKVLFVGDGINITALQACRAGIVEKAYILEDDQTPWSLTRRLAALNDLQHPDPLSPDNKCIFVDHNNDSTDLSQIDLIFAEPYVKGALLPWDHANFLNYLRQLAGSHDIKKTLAIFPLKLVIKAIPVEFEHLWKIHGPIIRAQGFDFSRYDQLIQTCQSIADETVEPQPLWEYPCVARASQPTIILDIAISTDLDTTAQTATLIQGTGSVNGIAFWAEYHFSETDILSTGPVGDIKADSCISWNRHFRQGVYFLPHDQVVQTTQHPLKWECTCTFSLTLTQFIVRKV